jgi:hypothetical protein
VHLNRIIFCLYNHLLDLGLGIRSSQRIEEYVRVGLRTEKEPPMVGNIMTGEFTLKFLCTNVPP